MHTLAQLNAGELTGVTRLQIAENLTQFPEAIYQLADSLEILDLSNNQLSELPDDLPRLHNLRIVFLSNNLFSELPAVLGKCPKLTMIGFKSNQISHISDNALPDKTRWLILTDNKLTKLPESIGKLTCLEKLMLAGNQLSALPDSMQHCQNLALLRLSANNFCALPHWLFTLPKLAWLAFSGNPISAFNQTEQSDAAQINLADLQLKHVLGQGASGIIYQANWQANGQTKNTNDSELAVKLFKGEVTSDGLPADELQGCLLAGEHPNLVKIIGQIQDTAKAGLVMALIPPSYSNLGLPPSLQTCSRDTFKTGFSLTLKQIKLMVKQMHNTVQHLHFKYIAHGDIYAHNTLFDEHYNIMFGDFGAATQFKNLSQEQQLNLQKIERRALLYFFADLLTVLTKEEAEIANLLQEKLDELFNQLASLSIAEIDKKLTALIS